MPERKKVVTTPYYPNPGDVVIIRSGGPLMTVVKYDTTSGLINCTWFVDNQVVQGDFDPNVVVPVSR